MAESAGTLVCPSCGAAVDRTAKACGYCGAVVEPPKPIGADGPSERRTFCPRCSMLYPTAAMRCPRCPAGQWDARGGRCPRCASDLESIPMGTVTVDRCRDCHGHWFDGDELEHVLDLTTQGVTREEAATLRPALPVSKIPLEEDVRYVACVRCGERMVRRQVAPRAGVVVDICRLHGVWFDGGEFEQFAEFAKAGGLEVVRHDGIASAEARAKSAASPTRDPAWIGEGEAWAGTSSGGWLVADALRAILRLIR